MTDSNRSTHKHIHTYAKTQTQIQSFTHTHKTKKTHKTHIKTQIYRNTHSTLPPSYTNIYNQTEALPYLYTDKHVDTLIHTHTQTNRKAHIQEKTI